tara:strand:+ start:64702 stop:65883 length:1182 start_codon:yes stop_codon:yes gene_type:complete
MKRILASLAVCSLTAVGCSDSDSSDGNSTSSAVSAAYTEVLSAANAITNLAPSSRSAGKVGVFAAPNFGTDWASGTGFVDEQDSSSTSAKEWMGIQLDPDAVRANDSKISMFGRLESALNIFCALGVAVDDLDASGYPSVGTQTFTVTSAIATSMVNDCDIAEAADLVDSEFTVVTAATTDDTYFDVKITLTLPAALGGSNQDYYVRSDSSEINVATIEDNDNGLHRTLAFLDLTNEVLRLEYMSGPSDGTTIADSEHISLYRLYYDEANDEGMMMALEFTENSGGDEDTRYVLAGKPDTAGATYSLSMISTSLTDTSSVHEACITASTGDIATDGSRCVASSTALNGVDVSAATAISSFLSGYDSTNYDEVAEGNGLTFTTSNFGTEAFTTE